jgi:hypothetical protein
MISAKEARSYTNKNIDKRQERAELWAANEQNYLEDRILRATAQGAYATDYWWSHSLLKEADITPHSAANALVRQLQILGYTVYADEHWRHDGMSCLKIDIFWEESMDE